MSKYFSILSLGTVVFLAVWFTQSPSLDASSEFETASLTATRHVLTGLKALGYYCAFSVLALGHGLLQRPAAPREVR